jgi:LacI family transcriptional regulator
MPAVHRSARATIVQVARHAGVSIKTVSRVSNGEPNVRAELRARVEAVIRELNYHPSLAARSLAGRRSRLLALAYDGPNPSYLLQLQAGARAVCQERGYRLLYHPCDSAGAALAVELLGLAEDPGIEGLILAPPLSGRASLVERLAAGGLPHALLAAPQPGPCAVLVDDEAAGVEATAHLLGLGHRRIGFIVGHPDHAATPLRQRGYERALRDAGIGIDPRLIEPGEYSFESGRRAAFRLLGTGHRPTAILASSDDMAAGAISAARSSGLELPRELSVTGFDDTPLAAMLWPSLTTMHQPVGEMAALATRLLLDQLAGPDRPASCATPPASRLVVRASTCAPP